ncbi:MAG: serine/threonine protein kinase [Alphaproteobacteria bacterium]|nr:serine/threonine protein kinase [Alphaproteobacteria bacterium]
MPHSIPWPKAPIARRYRAEKLLGRGGQGAVYGCVDELTGQQVAVKLVQRGRRTAEARREAAVLRVLALPGVARLLDEGDEDDLHYLVTERIHGTPFPGLGTPAPWAAVSRQTRNLLRALMNVHSAGVIHGDLKPANVLIDAQRRAWLLDFGLAHAGDRVLSLEDRTPGGTLHFISPEVLGGARPSVRSDLFAVGVMLYRTLAGRVPWPATDLGELRRVRAEGPAPSLADAQLPVPPSVTALVDALLQRDPRDRPDSAAAALEALDMLATATMLELPWLDVGPPLSQDELFAAFRGAERILHLRSDAARLLHALTGGHRDGVRIVLQHWVDMGVCRPDDGGLRAERVALDRLAGTGGPDSSAGDLRRLLETGGDAVGVLYSAADAVEEALDAGRHTQALALGELGMQVLRDDPYAAASAGPLLRAYSIAALATRSPGQLARASWELSRLPRVHGRNWLAAVLQATRDALSGRAEAAIEVLASLGPPPVITLELQAASSMALAAAALPVDAHAFILEQIRARLDPRLPGAPAFLDAWEGRLQQRRGAFAAAAACHQRAAEETVSQHLRLAALLDEAECRLDLGEVGVAAARAEQARELAAASRDAMVEARAWMIARRVSELRGVKTPPDIDLVDTIATLAHPAMLGAAALTEARIARSQAYVTDAQALAQRARAALHAGGDLPGAVLAAAIGAEAGDAASLWWAREHFVELQGETERLDGILAAALLFRSTGSPAWQELGQRLLEGLPDAERDRPHRGMSLREAADTLTGG